MGSEKTKKHGFSDSQKELSRIMPEATMATDDSLEEMELGSQLNVSLFGIN